MNEFKTQTLIETCMTLKRNSKVMSVISKQFELIEMSNKKICYKHFLNIHNVPDARMLTGNSIHSPGAAAPNHQYTSL